MRILVETSGGGGVVLLIGLALLAGHGGGISAALTAVVIALVVAVVLAIAGLGAYLVYRARQDRPGRPVGAPMAYQLPPEARPQLEESHKPTAIGPGREVHYHFHVDPEQLAAIINRIGHEE